jgi:hypothetical protein
MRGHIDRLVLVRLQMVVRPLRPLSTEQSQRIAHQCQQNKDGEFA